MKVIELDGDWILSRDDEFGEIPASVPGCVHTDLIAAGVIVDPYYRDSETRLQWIGEEEWIYTRNFDVPEEILSEDEIFLDCEGLDTLAVITLNGSIVAKSNNMFRRWKFDVKEFLQVGSNTLSICFLSALAYIREKQEIHPMGTLVRDFRYDGFSWLRKEQCNFGWDWGPMLVTCGIWRSIRLCANSQVAIDDLEVIQHHQEDGAVQLEILVELKQYDRDIQILLDCALLLGDKSIVSAQVQVTGLKTCIMVVVEQPSLWWPNRMGEQPLYTVQLNLTDSTGATLDSRNQKIGLRHFELIREKDEWGESFKFSVNGIEFFAKGANWIPADTFDCNVTQKDIGNLLKSSVEANMNMIRVWGGGIYERDEFYDLCDELGLVVWQDFMFACSAYPVHESDFLENVREEAIYNVKRLRHHASIAIWCGNNEMEHIPGIIGEGVGQIKWHHYSLIFDELLREIVETFDPQVAYWPSSEHSPIGNRIGTYEDGSLVSQDPRWGDAHLWDVWHKRKPFEWYRGSYHRFCSEFGFQSFPHPATVDSYTRESDRNITSYVMEKHQRSDIGNTSIITYMLSWFRLPVGHENVVWVSQILQGLAIKYAVEHWRRQMPRCMGAIYWQLNDCWPVASWSSIDSLHRWKALHYAAKKFFAPILVSGVERIEEQSVEIHITSDLLEKACVLLEVFWISLDGTEENLLRETVDAPSNGSCMITVLDVSRSLERHGARTGFVYLTLSLNNEMVSDNFVCFVKPKHMELQPPSIQTKWSEEEKALTLVTDKPSLWTWVDCCGDPDVRWSDNFFILLPSRPVTVRVVSASAKLANDRWGERLLVHELTETYA